MDMITDAMALVGQHGVYCQSQRWPGKPVMDIQIIMKSLTDAKELIQSVMEELRAKVRQRVSFLSVPLCPLWSKVLSQRIFTALNHLLRDLLT